MVYHFVVYIFIMQVTLVSNEAQASRSKIDKLLSQQGLSLIGVVDLAGNLRDFSAFEQWLSKDMHAGMKFMTNYLDIRKNPNKIEPGMVQTVMFGWNYYQGDRVRSETPRIAQYARMKDYHKVMKARGLKVLESLQGECNSLSGRVTVDSAPIMERSLASKSQRGFIGKNTCFIHPDKGSFLLLGAIHLNSRLFTLDVEAKVNPEGRSEDGGCGTCKRCQVNCPTGALDQSYTLDANLCLSYWSIEHRGLVPKKFWPYFKDFWFGCDICQLVCPYNRQISLGENLPLRESLKNIDLYEVALMEQGTYEKIFGGTPMTRAKISGLRRNAILAMWASGDQRLKKVQDLCLADESCPEVVKGTVSQILMTCDT